MFVIDGTVVWGNRDAGTTWNILRDLRTPDHDVSPHLVTDYHSGCFYVSDWAVSNYPTYVSCDGFKSLGPAYNGGPFVPVPLGDGTLLFARIVPPAQFLAKFTTSGEPVFSTYISGSDPVTTSLEV